MLPYGLAVPPVEGTLALWGSSAEAIVSLREVREQPELRRPPRFWTEQQASHAIAQPLAPLLRRQASGGVAALPPMRRRITRTVAETDYPEVAA